LREENGEQRIDGIARIVHATDWTVLAHRRHR
jgi:hypothetical protein